MTAWIVPFLCGLGASILSAWGVGGGTLLLLVMTLFLDVDQRAAQGINLLFFLPAAASALVCHARSGCLDAPTLRPAIPPAAACALAGASSRSRPRAWYCSSSVARAASFSISRAENSSSMDVMQR